MRIVIKMSPLTPKREIEIYYNEKVVGNTTAVISIYGKKGYEASVFATPEDLTKLINELKIIVHTMNTNKD